VEQEEEPDEMCRARSLLTSMETLTHSFIKLTVTIVLRESIEEQTYSLSGHNYNLGFGCFVFFCERFSSRICDGKPDATADANIQFE
jgi:hypothetical protein